MKCSAHVRCYPWQSPRCTRVGVVEVAGSWYCRQHDPGRIEAVRSARRAMESARTAAQYERDRVADRIVDAVRQTGFVPDQLRAELLAADAQVAALDALKEKKP